MKYSIPKYTGPRFDLVWLGEIKEDGTEDFGHTVASRKTLEKIRKFADSKEITDWDHRIDEIGYEVIQGVKVETTIREHRIKP
jgi:hypothetical protein